MQSIARGRRRGRKLLCSVRGKVGKSVVARQHTAFFFSSPVASFVATSFISAPLGTSDPRLPDAPVVEVFVPPPVADVAVPPPTFAVRPPVPVRAAFGGIFENLCAASSSFSDDTTHSQLLLLFCPAFCSLSLPVPCLKHPLVGLI